MTSLGQSTPAEVRISRPTPDIELSPSSNPRYTIGTLVNDASQYAAMRASLISGGFEERDCEYLFIDNQLEPQSDAYRGLTAILNAARAPVVILCHQDVRLLRDGRAALDRRLSELEQRDPNWAVAGNAGGVAAGRLAVRITDPHGGDQSIGRLPSAVHSLDENLLIVKRNARVGFSRDLTGFHFYGADICLHASQMGYAAYVIDFHLEHLSPGKKDPGFAIAEQAFRTKWSRALRPRWVQTTCSLIYVSGAPAGIKLGRYLNALAAKIARRSPSAQGWSRHRKAAS